MGGDAPAAREAGSGIDGDVDSAAAGVAQSLERGSLQVAEHGSATVGENGGHPVPTRSYARVSDRVDATMQAMESARGNPHSHRARRQAERAQLDERYDAVLSSGEPGYAPIRRGLGALRQRY